MCNKTPVIANKITAIEAQRISKEVNDMKRNLTKLKNIIDYNIVYKTELGENEVYIPLTKFFADMVNKTDFQSRLRSEYKNRGFIFAVINNECLNIIW